MDTQRYLHRIACFVGGFVGAYTVIIRMNIGTAQTVNMMQIIFALFGANLKEALARAGAVICYAAAIYITYILAKKTGLNMPLTASIINAAGLAALGFLPAGTNQFVALYPTFVMMGVQWTVWNKVGGYATSNTFSTNNLRQFVSALADYTATRERESLRKAKVFFFSLMWFHIGVTASYFACRAFSVRASWAGLPVCAAAIVLSLLPQGKEEG